MLATARAHAREARVPRATMRRIRRITHTHRHDKRYRRASADTGELRARNSDVPGARLK